MPVNSCVSSPILAALAPNSRSLSHFGSSQIERAERMAGVWLMADGRKLELLPDGTVTLNSQPAKATWIRAKERHWNTALIRFGNPDDPADVWMARISSKEPGSLWINSRDKSSVATLQRIAMHDDGFRSSFRV